VRGEGGGSQKKAGCRKVRLKKKSEGKTEGTL